MNFIPEKIRTVTEMLGQHITKSKEKITNLYFVKAPYKKSNTPPSDTADWRLYDGSSLGADTDEHFWFKFDLSVPSEEGAEYRLAAHGSREGQWDATNPQCTLFIDSETAYQAFDTHHTYTPITEGEHKVYVYYYTGMVPGELHINFYLAKIDLEIEALYYDMKVAYDAMMQLRRDSDDYNKLYNVLDRATLLLDLRYPYSDDYMRSFADTRAFLKKELYEGLCGRENATLGMIGHTHIDVAWKWTLAQTREKAQRSFSTVLRLMEKYPDYIFMSSQPQLYQYVKEDDPALYERIKERVREGRWEVDGAMWLEADTNLASGESLVRQILLGKKFMRDEFGVESNMLWLPDVFGYSGALPQILKKSGVDRFYTAKLFWNETNKPRHDLFVWKGIDGSEVFTVLNDVYVKRLDAKTVKTSWEMHLDKRYSDIHVSTFGFGDGGGGPTAEMLESYARMKHGLPGYPKLVCQKARTTVDAEAEQFARSAEEHRYLPKWIGELYFEKHRGTYTTQANNKKFNRQCELLLGKTEALASMDRLFFGTEYPEGELYGAWIKLLRNQFHDIIPGSSINEVYRDSDREYAEIKAAAEAIADKSLAKIASEISTDGGLLVYNSAPFAFSGTVDTEEGSFYVENIPAHGYKVVKPAHSVSVSAHDRVIENDLVRVTFDEKYEISSFYDKRAEREIACYGERLNILEIFEDVPFCYDAWEISDYYTQKRWRISDLTSVETIDLGERAGYRITRNYGKSCIVQEITLSHGSARLDIKTEVDWQETHSLLKAAFPLDIHASRANYEIQFGHLDRPTHRNSLADEAMFEVSAHKWVDLSEGDYGVSLLNDCKYGYSCDEGRLSISLLRSSTDPDRVADKGHHSFTYSLLPHVGALGIETVREGYLLNTPPTVMPVSAQSGALPESLSLVTSDAPAFVVETFKAAEDGDGYIIRGYESLGRRVRATLSLATKPAAAELCDLMERKLSDLPLDGGITIDAKPFEIVTLRVRF